MIIRCNDCGGTFETEEVSVNYLKGEKDDSVKCPHCSSQRLSRAKCPVCGYPVEDHVNEVYPGLVSVPGFDVPVNCVWLSCQDEKE